ncbi:MAG: adenylosuccinate synthetase [Candidatus Altiarchaeum hamiconexum]|uniref:Adenylosuccinate synthetase n=1 Tax=Candidatus Altarchaeum hamiconexum TaxID=1803513 RepID=A0A8J7YSL6_9ARCH|nr:adenylosuccinate synthetase [Candidatus Altarchaeum hamiconexum]OIQ06142.1 MAG: adenylosuccinate synthetase [Candidatus Altarchaeum sp. CG2_30_32_3053]PIN66841.1 MAG: adenylosuccinate synthetase [Candidatus Altarchaeum sp. CG12_big_fil_rev_8_21_14_0_65_33_22]PIV28902.1 MAG: adenylosuccinate synthetase [Candidatus Altarchaeum sp. CG03_land_8_20_14_0_80_32_618]PIZ29375.1 MAG: adenylosuccinate synthetase [Candidatus Altarchaeum sp. CG_4_10_14_0_8_um_filter_32_851]PJC14979.1 MAG: adenylosuccina
MCNIVVGGQFGDEGKGKIISYLSLEDNYDIIARGGVGPNAGHTIVYDGQEYKVRQVPSGFLNKNTKLYIGAGVLVNPDVFLDEISKFNKFNIKDRINVDFQSGIIEESHKVKDKRDENLSKKVQTTGSGCGPANEDRVKRVGKMAKDIPELKEFICDVAMELNNAIDEGKKILIEGTQGFGLSLYHGTYPYVTTKDTTASAMLSDVGIGPKYVNDVIVVLKAYTTRVGNGLFWNEADKNTKADDKKADNRSNKLLGDLKISEKLAKIREEGTVTGRARRVSPFDFELAKRSAKMNSATMLALTNMDRLFDCANVRNFDGLPEDAKKFIKIIEGEVGVKVKIISTGREYNNTIDLRQGIR